MKISISQFIGATILLIMLGFAFLQPLFLSDGYRFSRFKQCAFQL